MQRYHLICVMRRHRGRSEESALGTICNSQNYQTADADAVAPTSVGTVAAFCPLVTNDLEPQLVGLVESFNMQQPIGGSACSGLYALRTICQRASLRRRLSCSPRWAC
jgi:hypothetical protein